MWLYDVAAGPAPHSTSPKEGIMKTWNTPTFCETCVGAEINCYASNSPD